MSRRSNHGAGRMGRMTPLRSKLYVLFTTIQTTCYKTHENW